MALELNFENKNTKIKIKQLRAFFIYFVHSEIRLKLISVFGFRKNKREVERENGKRGLDVLINVKQNVELIDMSLIVFFFKFYSKLARKSESSSEGGKRLGAAVATGFFCSSHPDVPYFRLRHSSLNYCSFAALQKKKNLFFLVINYNVLSVSATKIFLILLSFANKLGLFVQENEELSYIFDWNLISSNYILFYFIY